MKHINRFLINIVYTFFANGFSLLITMIVMLILPKFLNVSGYGYWQLYVLYTGYLGLFHLGLCDGIYLKYGGKRYSEINKDIYSQQFKIIILYIFALIGFGIVFFCRIIDETNKRDILILTAFALLFYTPKNYLLLTMQAVGDFKNYSRTTICERITFFICIMFLFILGIKDYRYYIVADILSRIISLIYVLTKFKNIILISVKVSSKGIKECILDIRSGYAIVIAGIASNLIVGIVRISIENIWNIEIFSKVSLALSILNIVLSFVNMISLVMFPFLNTITTRSLIKIFSCFDEFSVLGLLGILFLGLPISLFIKFWLPEYIESIDYFCILLPSCLMECKMAVLCNSYFKTLKEQRKLLYINLLMLAISAFSTLICIYVLKSLIMAVYLIAVLLCLREIISEIVLRSLIDIRSNQISFYEVFFISLYFILFSIFNINGASIISLLVLVLVLLKNRNKYLLVLKDFNIVK